MGYNEQNEVDFQVDENQREKMERRHNFKGIDKPQKIDPHKSKASW